MSAFIVGKDHIDLLVSAATDYEVRWFTDDRPRTAGKSYADIVRNARDIDPNDIGAMLVRENVASVSDRYPDDKPGELPGPVDAYYTRPFRFQRVFDLPSTATILHAIAGYEYQSCEHDGWEVSEARFFCEALRSRLVMLLPAPDGAWDWSRAA